MYSFNLPMYSGIGNYPPAESSRWGASLSFVASEFQALRLEFSSSDDGQDISNSIFLQYNITIGSHPAHLY